MTALMGMLSFLGLALLLGGAWARTVLGTGDFLKPMGAGAALLAVAWAGQAALTLHTLGLGPADAAGFLTSSGVGRAMLLGVLGATLALAAAVSGAPPLLAAPGAALCVWGAAGVGHGAGHEVWVRALHATHLGAMGLWVGGVLALLVTRPLGVRHARRFTPVAVASVSLLAVSGLLMAQEHLPDLNACTGTTYGRTLLLKLLLVTATLGAAALVRRAFHTRERSVRQLLLRETLLLLAVLGVSAALANTPPPHAHPDRGRAGRGQFGAYERGRLATPNQYASSDLIRARKASRVSGLLT
ncbi:CopD family protein (plasmid) [Deinococcus taeanensis]|uniref:CopD family protein n=1 Tax=Deinococcus taeanensis TaxID=2737050 RepID=UPI001CDB746A|nr:CopD family protein [Deinococcus taeanensis]UBV44886.1 CopD family protein [Deinococcus taeanensis]